MTRSDETLSLMDMLTTVLVRRDALDALVRAIKQVLDVEQKPIAAATLHTSTPRKPAKRPATPMKVSGRTRRSAPLDAAVLAALKGPKTATQVATSIHRTLGSSYRILQRLIVGGLVRHDGKTYIRTAAQKAAADAPVLETVWAGRKTDPSLSGEVARKAP